MVVGYYRTTGEFFLVSTNSSTIFLNNVRLRQQGGKENALFLQAVSISFHNERISMREGPVADFTINHHTLQNNIISEARKEKKNNIAKSRREEALCASFPLIAFFSIRSNDETSDWGIIKCRKCFLISFLDLSSKSSSLKARQYERMETQGDSRGKKLSMYMEHVT